MPKYALLRQRVMEAELVANENLQVSTPASDEQILRVHELDYLTRLIQGRMTRARNAAHGFSLVARPGRARPVVLSGGRLTPAGPLS